MKVNKTAEKMIERGDQLPEPVVHGGDTPRARPPIPAARAQLANGDPHPLFPMPADASIPQIAWISLVRFEPGRGPVDCGRVFAADELQEPLDIANLYGGGSYELRGRGRTPDGRPGPLLRTQRLLLDGPSIPFATDQAAAVGATFGAAAAVAAAPAPAMDPMLAMMMTMVQEGARESRQAQQAMMQLQIQSAQQSQQMLLGVLTPILQALSTSGKMDLGPLLQGLAAMQQSQMAVMAQLVPKTERDPVALAGQLMDLSKKLQSEETMGEVLTGVGEMFGGLAQMAGNIQPPPVQQQQQQPVEQQTSDTERPPPPANESNGYVAATAPVEAPADAA